MFVTVQDNFLVRDLRSLPYFLEEAGRINLALSRGSWEIKLGPLSWKPGD
jgi:hypothetical protein